MDLHKVLQTAVKTGASDIHLKVGAPPMLRINGNLQPVAEAKRLAPETLSKTANDLMNATQRERFKKQLDIDLAYGVPGIGRFRVNVFVQRGCVGCVFRVIPYKVPPISTLRLPPVIQKIAEEPRGLVLVTGATGSGKSTTLASMVEHINATRTAHVVTIEDPIEFLIRDKQSIINQREIGTDSITFRQALKAALRQDPDVILVGEMRDLETIRIALHAAETGHLVLSTLHTLDAGESISRIISTFPPHEQSHARIQVASLLRAVICQRLVRTVDGASRVPAVEVMLSTARIRELILDENRTRELPQAIADGYDTYGMQTFDMALLHLLHNGMISYEEASMQSSNRDDFALKVSGIDRAGPGEDPNLYRPSGAGGVDHSGTDFEIERF